MFTILVVDDEEWIREGIMLKLKKSEFPLSGIYGAGSGEEALKIIKNKNINIIITDIRMDNMDGLELVEKVKEITDDVEFIMISGYSEFKYAKQAINMGVKGYLLKPTTSDDLHMALNKAIDSIMEKREHNWLSKENEKNRVHSEKLTLEKELNKLLNTKDEGSVYLNNIKHDIIKVHNFYQLLVISIDHVPVSQKGTQKHIQKDNNYIENNFDDSIYDNDDNDDNNNNNIYGSNYKEIESLKISFSELLYDAVNDDNYYTFCNLDIVNQLFILVWGEKEKIDDLTEAISKKCFYNIADELDIPITIGISSIMKKINQELYKSAKKALDLRLIYGVNKIYKESDINIFKDFVFPRSELKLLSRFIEKRDLKKTGIILSEIFSKQRFEGVNISNLYFLYSEVVNVIYGTLYTINRNLNGIIEYDTLQNEVIKCTYRLEDIAKYLNKVIDRAIRSNSFSCSSCKELVEKVVKYIDVHYAERINVKELAEKFSIDANYFSTIFKKELGVTFTKYITMQRMNNACRMLRETDICVQEIAKSIGYWDIQYFYRVFKKEFGVTPIEYRS